MSLDLGGITLFAVTPTCYLRDVNGSMILENFPEPKHQVRGYVRVNTHMIGDGNVEVHLPDMQSNYKVVTSIESVLSISCARTLF